MLHTEGKLPLLLFFTTWLIIHLKAIQTPVASPSHGVDGQGGAFRCTFLPTGITHRSIVNVGLCPWADQRPVWWIPHHLYQKIQVAQRHSPFLFSAYRLLDLCAQQMISSCVLLWITDTNTGELWYSDFTFIFPRNHRSIWCQFSIENYLLSSVRHLLIHLMYILMSLNSANV